MITPSNLTLSKDKKLLTVTFENTDYSLTSEYLRVYSPSAEVQGHGPGQETLQLNKNNVKIEKLNPMGNYAVAIHYDDGHSTGIYSWSYLHHLSISKDKLWQDYCKKIKENNTKKNNYHKVDI